MTIQTELTTDRADPQRRRAVTVALRRVLPDDALVSAPDELATFECDGLTAYREIPLLVVLPTDVGQVRAALRCCRELGVPVIPRGAGTGLSGGALPRRDGVLLSLTRMNRILEIDAENRIARVEPGVRNLAISEAVAPYGLFFAPDPSSQFASSIGGNVAENSGGVHCVKYGLTTHNLHTVTYVDMTGELITLGGSGYDAAGYDLMAPFTGSEGMLGVAVEIGVKLLPLPETVVLMQAAFPDMERAGRAVMEIVGSGITPSGLEMMDRIAIEVVENYIRAGLPTDAAALLLCELDGAEADVAAQIEQVTRVMRRCDGYDFRLARSAPERERLWQGRKAAFPALGQVTTDFFIMDATVPRRHLASTLARITELAEEYRLRVANTFHAGDGNLHPLILYDASIPDEVRRTEALANAILTLCLERGGTVTGEHGIGAEKLDIACAQFAEPTLEQFFALKRAFDPDGLLNPGKAIPTPRRCAELGGLHVHRGEVPFPGLERF